VLVVGGSRDLSGAPALVALGALRAGAGLVRVAVPRSVQGIVAGHRMEALTAGLEEDDDGALVPAALERIRALAEEADVVAIGPGAGRAPGTRRLLRSVVTDVRRPMVVDADALFAWNEDLAALGSRREATVLTPHEGEAARLLGTTAEAIRKDRDGSARRLVQAAAGRGAVVAVLKGNRTIVTDGERTHRNETGGPVLASGGTGDVLCGIVAALMASPEIEAYEATCIGVWAHGQAALRVASGRDRGILASEVADALPAVLATLVAPFGNAPESREP
jgi:NAD(P)H-hydrate epimerase